MTNFSSAGRFRSLFFITTIPPRLLPPVLPSCFYVTRIISPRHLLREDFLSPLGARWDLWGYLHALTSAFSASALARAFRRAFSALAAAFAGSTAHLLGSLSFFFFLTSSPLANRFCSLLDKPFFSSGCCCFGLLLFVDDG